MNDLYRRIGPVASPYRSSAATTIQICIHRIEDLLDEEMLLLDQGALDELERVNIRKSHLLEEFERLSKEPNVNFSHQTELCIQTCRRKAQRNFEALETYLRAMEDLNRLILHHLRQEESDGTYSRFIISHSRT